MAIAEKTLAAQFNRPEFNIIDHHTYVFLGDGCLMEGISHEVCSLAGTLGQSYGWHVISDIDGHDPEAIERAVQQAQLETGKPSLVCCKTQIGFGSPNKAGKESCHGAPLGDDEIALVREKLLPTMMRILS